MSAGQWVTASLQAFKDENRKKYNKTNHTHTASCLLDRVELFTIWPQGGSGTQSESGVETLSLLTFNFSKMKNVPLTFVCVCACVCMSVHMIYCVHMCKQTRHHIVPQLNSTSLHVVILRSSRHLSLSLSLSLSLPLFVLSLCPCIVYGAAFTGRRGNPGWVGPWYHRWLMVQ